MNWLVTRLEVLSAFLATNKPAAETCIEAAREIERLAKENEQLKEKADAYEYAWRAVAESR